MKKFLAMILALAMVFSFAALAMAEDPADPAATATPKPQSPVVTPVPEEEPDAPRQEIYTGPALNQAKTDDSSATATLEVGGKEVDVEIVDIAKADTLEDADKEAFLAAYEAAKKVEGRVLKYMFWVPAGDVELAEGETADLSFNCEGEGVYVTANEKEVEVAADTEKGENAYTAKLTELPSAVAVFVNAEA